MAIDTTPSTVATNALQAIPFSSLIGGPLQAAIQAQSQAAMTTWNFIKEVGLTGPDNDRKAVSVVFQYQKGGQMVNLVVPLLAIVPIPYISIDQMTIDFKANISASSSSTSEQTESTSTSGEAAAHMSFGWGPFSVSADFKANYSSKKDSKATEESKYSVEYTMDIHVGASQSAMPAGLASILNILQSSITESPTEGAATASPSSFTLPNKADESQQVIVTVKDSTGLAVPNVVISMDLVNGPTGLTLKPLPADFKTDSSGKATVNVAIATPASDPNLKYPYNFGISIKAANVPNKVSGGEKDLYASETVTLTSVS